MSEVKAYILVCDDWRGEDIPPVIVQQKEQAIEWLKGEYDLHHQESNMSGRFGEGIMTFIDPDGTHLEFGLIIAEEGAR